MKRIFIITYLFVFANLLSAQIHSGEFYIDSGCENNQCLSEDCIGIIKTKLNAFKNAGKIFNVILCSHDCDDAYIRPSIGPEADTIIGPYSIIEGTNTPSYVWGLSSYSSAYVLYIEPGMVRLIGAGPGYSAWVANMETWSNLMSNSHLEYSRLYFKIINGVIDQVASAEGLSVNLDVSACENGNGVNVSNMVLDYGLDVGPNMQYEQHRKRLKSEYCSDVVFFNPYLHFREIVTPDKKAQAAQDIKERLNKNFLLIEYGERHPVDNTVNDLYVNVHTTPVTNLIQDQCYPVIKDLGAGNMSSIKQNIWLGSGSSNNIDVYQGFAYLANNLLRSNKPPVPENTYCDYNLYEETGTGNQVPYAPGNFIVENPHPAHRFETGSPSSAEKLHCAGHLIDYADLINVTQIDGIQEAVNIAQKSQLHFYIITSAKKPSGDYSSWNAARERYENFQLGPSTAVMWLHFDESETLVLDDIQQKFSSDLAGIEDFLEDFKLAITAAIQLSVNNLYHNNVPVIELTLGGAGEGENPWYFGLREGGNINDQNWFAIVGEIFRIAKDLTLNGEIPDYVWRPDGDCLFDMPGALIGAANAVFEEASGIVMAVPQMANLVYSLFTDENARNGMIEMLKHPQQIIFGQYIEIYEGLQEPLLEAKLYFGSKLTVGVAIKVVAVIASGGASQLVATGKQFMGTLTNIVDAAYKHISPPKTALNSKIAEVLVGDGTDIGLSAAQNAEKLRPQFNADYREIYDIAPELAKKFEDRPGLVERWNETVDNPSLRKDVDGLNKMEDAVSEGLDALDAVEDALEIVQPANPSPSWADILALFKRGNDFNRKARDNNWYPYHEIHLENGKRLDSYNLVLGEIVSRKATNFDNILASTFEGYLKEIDQKYSPGTKIKSNKYPALNGQFLQGNKVLEVPAANQTSLKLSEFLALANQYNTEIRFKPE